jgi:hypothetical protein
MMNVEEIEQYILDAGSDSLAVFGGTFEGGLHLQQVPDELAPCLMEIMGSGVGGWGLGENQIETYLEVGAAAGGTTCLIADIIKPKTIVIVDDNQHPEHTLRELILADVAHYEVIGNSRDPEIVVKALDMGPYDLMIIDGDHSYAGVKTDIENYLPMLREGGFLFLHDTATRQWGCEVPDVVKELKDDDRVELAGEYLSKKYPVCGIALFRKAVSGVGDQGLSSGVVAGGSGFGGNT